MVPDQFALKKTTVNQEGEVQTAAVDQRLITQKVLIDEVDPGSPAARAGLRSQDEIMDIGLPNYSPVGVVNAKKLPDITKNFAGKTVIVYYVRASHEYEARLQLLTKQAVAASQKTNNPKGYMGIVPAQLTVQRSTWSAPIVAVGLSAQMTALTFQGIGHSLAGLGSLIAGLATGNTAARQNGQVNATSQVAGPVGIFFILKTSSLLGYQYVLFFVAYLALILGFMNILPIPALDGGRLWLMLIARAIKRPLSPSREEAINAVGLIAVLILVILVTVNDVQRFF
jgi:regulator of sigma E protease